MIINKSRRHFLVGSGGALLALPILPSLYATEAQAQAAAQQRYFAYFHFEHGGIYQNLMFPAASTITEQMAYAGFQVRRGPLVAAVGNGRATISPVLSAAATKLTPAMVAKMNVINGVDTPFYNGHNFAQSLGNFADSHQADDFVLKNAGRMTINQLMAYSPSFYRNAAGVRERSIVVSSGDSASSWGWSNPSTRSGTLQRVVDTADTNLALFDKLFGASGASTTSNRPLVVDKMVDSYRRLRDGNSRLSAADKQRITEHLDRLSELQRKLQASAASGPPPRPTQDNWALRTSAGYHIDPSKQAQSEGLWNDIVVAAFASGLSAVHTRRTTVQFSNFGGDWHQDIVHQAHIDPAKEATLANACQLHFANVFLDFAVKLNAVGNGAGGTLLDNALVAWSHESGNFTHDSISVPIITFGSAGGFLRTGSYVDYRALNKPTSTDQNQWYGLLMHQWCNTALMAMGIPKSEFEKPATNLGYPDFKYIGDASRDYPASVWSAAGEVLPWLKA